MAAVLDKEAAGPERSTTVLLAEVRGCPPTALGVPSCLEVLRLAAEISGGRVVHDQNSAFLALFSTADAAAAAAARMQAYADTLPPASERAALGIAFHAGAVGQRNDEIFGDTVNLALQLVAETKNGQILTSRDTASSLSPSIQSAVRPARRIKIKGKEDELLLGELVWRNATQQIASAHAKTAQSPMALRLTCDGKTVLRRRQGDSIALGRDPQCELAIEGAAASRRHCTIERRATGFVLRDHSSNGTFVTIAGQPETCVKNAEIALSNSGEIALGQPGRAAASVITFSCE